MAEKKLPSVREHADKVISELIEKRQQTAPNADTAAEAVGLPQFSKGTATLDPDTGKPYAPEFKESKVEVPEESGHTAEELLAQHRERIAGTAPAETPEVAAVGATQEPPEAVEQTPAQARTEETAQAILEDFEEFDFEDPDLEQTYKVRVPKQYVETAKRGYGRRAAYDRSVRWLKEAEPVFKQMVENGQIHQVLPLIQEAINNQAFGTFVTEGYQRLQKGLPLMEAARAEIAAAAAPSVIQPEAFGEIDPFLAQQMRPVFDELGNLRAQIETYKTERMTEQERQVQAQQNNLRLANEMKQAHEDLARAYPDLVRLDLGPNDPFYQKAQKIAAEGGYANVYGVRAGIVFGGQQAFNIEQERASHTGSVAADLIAAKEKHLTLARKESQNAAQRVAGGAVAHAAPPPRPEPPSTKNPDGSLKPVNQYIREQQRYQASNRGA